MGLHHEILPSFSVLNTRDLDEARETVSSRYCDHRLDLAQGRALDAHHNHARGRHLSLNLLGYGGDVRIDPGELQDFYLLQIPLTGCARILHRGEEIDASPAAGTILNPDRPTQMHWAHDCTKLMVQIDTAFLQAVAQDSLNIPLPGPVRFAPRVDLASHGGQELRRQAIASARAIEAGVLRLDPADLQLLTTERELAQTLLAHQPSNISHLLATQPRTIAPRHIRHALDFIHGNIGEDIRLGDIAGAAGQHPRTLQIGFREVLGVSPMMYLRNLRLDTAHFHLSKRTGRPRVSDVAFDCGFGHLGRFSRDYRARFGHAPSALLRL